MVTLPANPYFLLLIVTQVKIVGRHPKKYFMPNVAYLKSLKKSNLSQISNFSQIEGGGGLEIWEFFPKNTPLLMLTASLSLS